MKTYQNGKLYPGDYVAGDMFDPPDGTTACPVCGKLLIAVWIKQPKAQGGECEWAWVCMDTDGCGGCGYTIEKEPYQTVQQMSPDEYSAARWQAAQEQ